MDKIKQIYKPPYRLVGRSIYTSNNVEMLMLGLSLSHDERKHIVDALNNNSKIELRYQDLQACPLSPCITSHGSEIMTIKGYSYMTSALKMTESQANEAYEYFKNLLVKLITIK